MLAHPLRLSMETLIGAAPMLGHDLEDRSRIRAAQDLHLAQVLRASSTVRLRDASQQALFCVAPLDVLVADNAGRKQFHLIEINGTGIGGLTNIATEAVSAVLDDLTQMARNLTEADPVILVAVSGKESEENPRLNRLIYEKVLYAEALRRGLEARSGAAAVTALPTLLRDPLTFHTGAPTVVIGYIKDLLNHLELAPDGSLVLFKRPVTAAVNDRFCLNLVQRFGPDLDLRRLHTLNRCFHAGADKGVAYALLNDFLQEHPHPLFPARLAHTRAESREVLIRTVLEWVRAGRRAVIKPQGTGLGHGIEFFLDAEAPAEQIAARIDASLRLTEQYYRAPGGALPYTVCEFIDSCAIQRSGHRLLGHKYELRVVVYRQGMYLKAFPSIVKVSSEAYNPARPDPLSLINNITTSATAHATDGTEFMLPLCNRETLELIDLDPACLRELCAFATCFIRRVLDRVQDEPEWFGLPGEVEPPARRAPLLQAA
jgi:hypothetical protein